MGTNYYLHEPPCEHCGRGPEPLHVGKSSGGWCFALHAIPEEGLIDLESWTTRFSRPDLVIRNEYGDALSPDELLGVIVSRSGRVGIHDPAFLADNHAENGPMGLLRRKIGPHCIAHGAGTWDLILGEFS
jgi:hypothetical protein